MSVSSYDTLGSDDELNTAGVGRWASLTEEREESIVQNQYDAYTAKLDADIEYWTTLAALYEEDEDLNFEWPTKTPICAYDKGIIMLKNAEYIEEGDLASSQELHDRHSWLAEYIAQKVQEKDEDTDDEDTDEPGRPIGIYRSVVSNGRAWRARKDRKKKYAHKVIDPAGRVKEAPYAPIKKPYPSWRKKKTGRNHKETLVPRKRGEFVREIVECYNLPCRKLDFNEEEEPTIEFVQYYRPPLMTLRGVKRVLF